MYDIELTKDLINFNDIFYNLLEKENIKVNKDYQFVYDDMLQHLTNDTLMYSIKNYNTNRSSDLQLYISQIFKVQYINHRHKLYNPEKNPEYIRQLRINKLKKINNYGRV